MRRQVGRREAHLFQALVQADAQRGGADRLLARGAVLRLHVQTFDHQILGGHAALQHIYSRSGRLITGGRRRAKTT